MFSSNCKTLNSSCGRENRDADPSDGGHEIKATRKACTSPAQAPQPSAIRLRLGDHKSESSKSRADRKCDSLHMAGRESHMLPGN